MGLATSTPALNLGSAPPVNRLARVADDRCGGGVHRRACSRQTPAGFCARHIPPPIASFRIEPDGKVTCQEITEDYKQYIKYLAMLWEKGYIYPEDGGSAKGLVRRR